MTTLKERFFEFDILRVLALLLILYTHSNAYIGRIEPWEWYRTAMAYTGLGLFVFLSSYGLQYSASAQLKVNKFNKMNFFLKRVSRIYPLYIITLIGFLIVFGVFNIYHTKSYWDFTPFPASFIIHILSLQGLLNSIFPSMQTLWFIGMIIPFYMVFAFTVPCRTPKFIQVNTIIFITLIAVEFLLQTIDFRLILYYPIFILGAISSRQDFMHIFRSHQGNKILVLTGFLASGSYWLYKHLSLPYISRPNLTYNTNHLYGYLLVTIFLVSVIPCLIVIASRLSGFLNKFQSQLIYLSNLSYAAYLFHRIVYALVYYLFDEKFNFSLNLKIALFPLATLLVFATADVLCRLEHYLWEWWRSKSPKMAG